MLVDNDLLDVSYDTDAYYKFLNIYGPIGLSINILGIVCILSRSGPELGTYKWYLLNYQACGTLTDALYDFLQYEILFPIPGGRDSEHELFLLDQHASNLIVFCFTAASGAAVVSCFMYRYNVILNALGRGFSSGRLHCITVILHIFTVLPIAVLFALSNVPYDITTKILLEKYPHLASVVYNRRTIIYWPEANPFILYFMAYASLQTILLTVLATIFYVRTMSTLTHLHGMMTAETYKMNRSLTFVLLTIIPYLLLVVPLLGMLSITILNINHSTGTGMTLVAIMSTHASGNTLVLLVMVKSYRDFVFYWPFVVFRLAQRMRNAWRARRVRGPTPATAYSTTEM